MKHYSSFSLFQSHLDLAHSYWEKVVIPGSIVIDATCGNGHDTLVLAKLALSSDNKGLVIGMDKQAAAIESTRQRLTGSLSKEMMDRIVLLNQCHSTFPDNLMPETVSLIVYNLGYLPGGDKGLTTMASSTINSIMAALPLIHPGGGISITCYPGHQEGRGEETLVKEFASNIDPRQWSCCYHSWLNRQNAPSLLLIQKAT